jgi:hypothetical protein
LAQGVGDLYGVELANPRLAGGVLNIPDFMPLHPYSVGPIDGAPLTDFANRRRSLGTVGALEYIRQEPPVVEEPPIVEPPVVEPPIVEEPPVIEPVEVETIDLKLTLELEGPLGATLATAWREAVAAGKVRVSG